MKTQILFPMYLFVWDSLVPSVSDTCDNFCHSHDRLTDQFFPSINSLSYLYRLSLYYSTRLATRPYVNLDLAQWMVAELILTITVYVTLRAELSSFRSSGWVLWRSYSLDFISKWRQLFSSIQDLYYLQGLYLSDRNYKIITPSEDQMH